MPKNKKKFIPKEKALVFQLVHRSQQDPLVADEKAPQHVLKQLPGKKNKEEEHKYGIFFDDEYDYLQHLKTLSEPCTDWEQVHIKPNEKRRLKKSTETKVLLPSSVFESEIEESLGLLNKAAPIYGPRPELDPDIVAALDDDFDFDNPDNILEDNFMELANQSGSEDYNNETDDNSETDSLYDLKNELHLSESKSLFTDYSMTSSVIRRNENLVLLDNHFERVFQKYDDSNIGCLSNEDIEGTVSAQSELDSEKLIKLSEKLKTSTEETDSDLKNRIIIAAAKQSYCDEETDLVVVENPKDKTDCESILSTYSNLYNHPAKICEPQMSQKIKINKKTGIPEDVFSDSRLTAQNLSLLDGQVSEGEGRPKSIVSYISELSIRPKNERPEEKRVRKQNIKLFRRDRRIEKKANKLAFKNEKCRQEKILLNVKTNQQGIRMF